MAETKTHNYYTFKYLLALSIIALLSVIAYFMLRNSLKAEEGSATTVKLASEQKILTQQIAYLGLQLANSPSTNKYGALQKQMFDAIQQLHDNYQELSNEQNELALSGISDNSDIIQMYFSAPHNVDVKLDYFRKEAINLLNTPKAKLNIQSPHLANIQQMAAGSLQSSLTEILNTYEATSKDNLKNLQWLEWLVLGITFLVLLLEIFFIFRPMTRKIEDEKNKLLNSQKLMNSVLNTVAEGIITIDANNKIVMLNHEAEQMWLYKKERLLGRDFFMLLKEHCDTSKKDIYEIYQTQGFKALLNKRFELMAKRRNKSQFPIEIKITETDIDNRKLFTIAVTDITERKIAEKALLEANSNLEQKVQQRTQELQRSNADIAQFTYIASHDLKEPLRMIAGYTQLIKRKYQDQLDKEANEFIDFAVEGSLRANKLIEELLEYTQLNKEKNDQRIDLGSTIKKVQTQLNNYITQNNATIVVNNELPEVEANEVQIRYLFQNLITNAIKFKANSKPVVTISSNEEKEHFLFAVKDNGIGMEDAYQNKVFKIFQRLNPRNKYHGNGMGLAICKRIVEQHNGKIWFESQPGNGTTFYFTIPKVAA